MTARCWLALSILAAWSLPSAAQGADAAVILGRWLTEPRDGIIEITRAADNSLQGRIIGGNDPHRVDQHNPDPALRQRPLLGQMILQGMHADGEGVWSGGTIYEPDSGHTYKCRLELLDHERLKVRGFLGISLLGKSQIWTRYGGTELDLSGTAH